jgi:Uma2 family endonuclease
MLTEVRPKQFTVDDYYGMVEAGILRQDERVELISGEIVEMSPIGGPHMTCVNFLNELLVGRFRGKLIVSIQNPVRLDKRSEPQPDVTLIKPREAEVNHKVPSPADVLIVMEVSDTTLRYDRDVKIPLYAAAAIPEAFIIDVHGQAIERYTKPVDGSYRLLARVARGEAISSTVLPELSLEVDEVLGL